MKKSISGIALAVTLLAGCVDQEQVPDATLYEVKIPFDAPGAQEQSFTGNLEIGPEGKRVPVHIAWTAKLDSTGCLRISHIKVSRQGGDPSTVISDVKHSANPNCGIKFESEDTRRYQTVLIQLHYEARKLIKTYTFDGSVASILGNGEFTPL